MVLYQLASMSLLRSDFGWFGDLQMVYDMTFHI